MAGFEHRDFVSGSAPLTGAPLAGNFFSDEVIHGVFVPLLRSTRFLDHGGSNTGAVISLLLGYLDVVIGWGSVWDFAAGKLFVEMMGGATATFHGDPIDVNVIAPQRVVFARNRALLDAVLPFTSAWPVERELRATV